MEEKELNEKESLSLISEMIQKAKSSFHESGTSAILWGSVTAVCAIDFCSYYPADIYYY